MPSINSSELEHIEEGQGNVWLDAIPMLHDEDHRIRNEGVDLLRERLSPQSDLQLLQTDKESYREGVDLLLERVEDNNYTVRMFAVTTLAVVLEATEGMDQYRDIHETTFTEIMSTMGDENPKVSVCATDVVGNIESNMKRKLKDLEGEEKSKMEREIESIKKRKWEMKRKRFRNLNF
jgi:hypothetical protein